MQIKPVTVAALLVIVLAGGAEALRFAPAFQPLFPLLPWAPPECAIGPIHHVDRATPIRRIFDDFENAIESALVFPGELAKTKGPIELGLRPSFDLRENADGYVVSCLTPGLKKEDLHAEVVGTDAFPVLVVRGESKEEHGTPPAAKDKKDAKDATNAKEKASFFRTKYQKFEQRMSLPPDVDQFGRAIAAG
ncbi:hypothetical protein T484DRAFT_1831271 [Baffinella frigidus]|nr:hypothetical protein T484DRAFT_1831271 [Cryptophyta sp. CCMP2293]